MKKLFHVLLVDDDATDRELFIDVIQSSGNNYRVSEAANGKEALDFLQKTDELPHLVILDLNMPVMDGRLTLREIKTNKSFRSIPVCILSTSSAPFDISFTYENGANLFLVKPFDFKELTKMLNTLLGFFSEFVTLAPAKVQG